jgi:hypothetical protein
VLTTAGLGSILGSGIGILRGLSTAERAAFAEKMSLGFAVVGLMLFVAASLGQAVTSS